MSASCSACGKAVDPLRAGHVAIFDDQFRYFCDATCGRAYAPGSTPRPGRITLAVVRGVGAAPSATPGEPPTARSPLPSTRPESPSGTAELTVAATAVPAAAVPATAAADATDAGLADGGPASSPPSTRSRRAPYAAAAPSDLAPALLWAAGCAGGLALALALAGASNAVTSLRIALSVLSWACVALRALRAGRQPTEAHPLLVLAPGALSCAVAVWTWMVRDPALGEATMFAAVVVSETAAAIGLVERARHTWSTEKRRIAEVLGRGVLAARDSRGSIAPSPRPGEEVEVLAGQGIEVDGVVVGGEAIVVPWIGARDVAKRREGDSVHAGASVVSGWLRVRITYVGLDRAWARLTLDPRRRAEVHAGVARAARRIADRGALAAFALAGAAALANGESAAHIALSAIGALAALACITIGSMPAVHVARGVLEGLRRGIAYRSPADWDRAGEVSIVAFCARGTLLLGEPELADLTPLGKSTEGQVLSLAAGAESGADNPVASAVQRAALARRVRPDAVRSPIVQPGLGVTAVASTGEPLCVGSRALMLREKISVALAEQTIAAIEARGREVLLVALSGKLIGVVGLQDGLRPGARAAVQHLLDAQVEPVLISGDTRETCEAIGRALDIDHIRPEVLAADRAKEIERLGHGGITVGVLGHPRSDESTLSAADVAVAMPAPGGTPGEWAVMLASDDVRDGAMAISLARRTKHDAKVALLLALAPGVVAALAVAFGLLAPAWAPIAALLGALASGVHARASDLTRSGLIAPAVKSRQSLS